MKKYPRNTEVDNKKERFDIEVIFSCTHRVLSTIEALSKDEVHDLAIKKFQGRTIKEIRFIPKKLNPFRIY